jgi:opacity protein-like surface antigen
LLKKLTVIGLTGIALIATPASADNVGAIAGTLATAVAAAVGCAGGTHAVEDDAPRDAYDRTGFVMTLGAGYAMAQFDDKHTARDYVPADEAFDNWSGEGSFVIGGSLGYRCHPRFSVEGEVYRVGGFKTNVRLENSGVRTGSIDIEPLVILTNVKAFILTGRIQPWVTIGSGLIATDYTYSRVSKSSAKEGDRTALAWRFGAGADYYLTEKFVLQAKVDYLVTPSVDHNMVTIGAALQYRF